MKTPIQPPKWAKMHEVLDQRQELLAALRKLVAECQDARKYIVLDNDYGFAAYNATAEAIVEAREVIAKCES